MAVLDTTNVAVGTGNGLGRAVRRLIASASSWNDKRITRKALSRLSDRELEDIGLNRGDIDRITG